MNSFIFFFVYISISAMFGAYLFVNKKQVDEIMKREDSSYTGLLHNSIDIYRIYKVFRRNKSLSLEERKILKSQFNLSITSCILLIGFFILLFIVDW